MQVVSGVYGCAGEAVDGVQLVQQMASVSWSISSLESQHNAYVDDVLRQMQVRPVLSYSKLHPTCIVYSRTNSIVRQIVTWLR